MEDVLEGIVVVVVGLILLVFVWVYNELLEFYLYDFEKVKVFLKEVGVEGVEFIFYVIEGGFGMFDLVVMGMVI